MGSVTTKFENSPLPEQAIHSSNINLNLQRNMAPLTHPHKWQVAQKAGELFQNHETGECVGMPHPEATTAAVVVTEKENGVTIAPEEFWKTRTIVERILQHNKMEVGLRVSVECGRVGVGMASSTSSMRAASMATFKALGIHAEHTWLAAEMAIIEPSDSNTSDGKLALWNFFKGKRCSQDYSLPIGAYVVAIPPASHTLLTAEVNRTRPQYSHSERIELAALRVDLLLTLEKADIKGLAKIASRSIEINDTYFPKLELPLFKKLRNEGITFGHFGGHSGTILGAIGEVGSARKIAEKMACELPNEWRISFYDYTAEARTKPFLLVRPNFINCQQ